MGKWHKLANGVKNLRHDSVSRVRVFPCNEIAYVVEVCEGFGWEKTPIEASNGFGVSAGKPCFPEEQSGQFYFSP